MEQESSRFEMARRIFRKHGGILRAGQAIHSGIHPRVLYAMRDAGVIERLGRGLYRLAELPPFGDADLVTVSLRVPRGVVCLISALAYHELTSHVPHEIYLALERGRERPRIEYPPVRVFWFSPRMFREGVESHEIDGVWIRVYSPEKTLADCFKYRNKIGLDVALEALRRYQEGRNVNWDKVLNFARLCRVENVMRPYLEVLV